MQGVPVAAQRTVARPVSRLVAIARLQVIVLTVLFVAALGVRMYHVNDPPLNFQATREYRSLIIARADYFEHAAVPAWQKQVADFSRHKQGVLEPPIYEKIVSYGYLLAGGEAFWIPKLLSSLFWLAGGYFLYLIALRITDGPAAIFSVAFYLFLPFSIIASRSFQPDPLMIMLLLLSIWLMLRYYERPTTSALLIAAGAAALAFLVKPVSLFVIVSAFVAMGIAQNGIRRTIFGRATVIFGAVLVLPTLGAYLYGIVTGRFLLGEAEKTVIPRLLVTTFFWQHLLDNIGAVVGFGAFTLALIGVLLVREGLPRALLIGLWAGFGIFCIAIDYNVAAHDYYQLQLIPIVALSLGPVAAIVIQHLRPVYSHWFWGLALSAIVLLALLLSVSVARPRLVSPGSQRLVSAEEQIGAQVDHSTDTVFLASDYGVSLEYHGLMSGYPWPLASDLEWERLTGSESPDAQARFDTWFAQRSPEYFIVLDMNEFEQQPDLQAFLTERYPVLAETDDYLIFDLRHPKTVHVMGRRWS
ncbi:MAG TPA: glycosyltransferase family 39 protein [Nitrolancea sp.]|nr:glycosyltransferase family 39 protein [Nitrolancea sp.]